MSDFTVRTMDEAAFFDGVTWLNQDNWQKFFGKSLPNGVLVDGALELGSTGYSLQGTLDLTQYSSYITIGRGCVMADGLYAELANDVQVMNVTEDERTKFICVQFNSEQSVAKIVEKVDVANQQGVSLTTALTNLVTDESFFCTRNANIYEIPIAFEYYSSGLKILDLRRLVYAPSGKKRNLTLSIRYNSTGVKIGVLRGNSYAQLFGGTTYFIPITSDDTASYMNIYPMPTNSNEQITIFLSNETGSSKKYMLRKASNGTTISYEWVSNWSNNANGVFNTLPAGASTIIILTPVQVDTGSIKYAVITKSVSGEGDFDPDNYYNKNEIDNMLGTKEGISDINAKLALKEDIAKLKTLAYLDKVNYATQVTNKPSDVATDNKYYARRNQAWAALGAMANINDVGTTGAYYARRNNAWAALGAMANAADDAKDGKYYARRNNAWTALGAMANAADAANDSKYYARRNNTWTALGAMANVADADKDDKYYARRNNTWTALGNFASAADVGNSNYFYARRNDSWKSLSDITFYVSSNGSADNDGTESKPFDKLSTAIKYAPSGALTTILVIGNTLPAERITINKGKKILLKPKIDHGYLNLSTSSVGTEWCTISNGSELILENSAYTITGAIYVQNGGILNIRLDTASPSPLPAQTAEYPYFMLTGSTNGIVAMNGGIVNIAHSVGVFTIGTTETINGENIGTAISANRCGKVHIFTNISSNFKLNSGTALNVANAGFLLSSKITGSYKSLASVYQAFLLTENKYLIGTGTIENYN